MNDRLSKLMKGLLKRHGLKDEKDVDLIMCSMTITSEGSEETVVVGQGTRITAMVLFDSLRFLGKQGDTGKVIVDNKVRDKLYMDFGAFLCDEVINDPKTPHRNLRRLLLPGASFSLKYTEAFAKGEICRPN
jgi:hypothetical protein